MGLRVSIYRSASFKDSLSVFKNVDELVLVNVEGPHEPDEKAPAALLVPGNARYTAKVVPAKLHGKLYADAKDVWLPADGWFMMEGAYVATSDSRFVDAVEKIVGSRFYGAAALHGRIEA